MSEPRSLSEILAPLILRCVQMQPMHDRIRACPTRAEQKRLIMAWRQDGDLTGEEATLLIQSYGLETA